MSSSSSKSPKAATMSGYTEANKDVSVNKSARSIVEEAFHLKHQPLPQLLQETMIDSQHSIVSDFNNQQEMQAKLLQNLFDNPKLSVIEKEKIAKSILQGNFEIQSLPTDMTSNSRPNTTGNTATINKRTLHPVHTKDRDNRQSATQENKLYLSRFNLPKPHFLQVVTQTANIPTISPKDIREQQMDSLRKRHASLHTLPPEISASFEVPPSTNASTLSPQHQSFVYASTTEDQKFPFQSTLSRPITSQKSSQLFYNENPHYKENCSRIMIEEKKKRIVRARDQIYSERDKIRKQKEFDQLSAEKRLELKKKLNDFRQMLREYLIKTKEPKSGDIMRCIDDSMIYYFMEQYNGHHLSPKAILSLLSNSMGTSIIHTNSNVLQDLANPNDPIDMMNGGGGGTGVEYEPDDWQYVTGGGMEMSEVTGPPLPTRDTSPSRLNNNMKGSVSNRLNYLALKKNYKEFGRRSPPKLQEYYLSDNPHYLQSRPNTTNAAYFDSYENGDPLGTNRPKRFQSNEPVDGYLPRPSDFFYNMTHPEAPLQQPTGGREGTSHSILKPTLGSGFRTRSVSPNQSLTRSQVMMGMTADHVPATGFSQPNRPHMSRSLVHESPYPNNGGPLVVLSSEHVHKVAKSMGISLTSKEDEEVLRSHIAMTTAEEQQNGGGAPYDDSYLSNSRYYSSSSPDGGHTGDDSQSVASLNNAASNAAISIMHEQLMEESLLPSLRPERVLTDKQIEELGLHKKTLDEIFTEIDKQHHVEDDDHIHPQGSVKSVGHRDSSSVKAHHQQASNSEITDEIEGELSERRKALSMRNIDEIEEATEAIDEERLAIEADAVTTTAAESSPNVAAIATATVAVIEMDGGSVHTNHDLASRGSSKSGMSSLTSAKSRGTSAHNAVPTAIEIKEHIEELIQYEIQQEALIQQQQQQVEGGKNITTPQGVHSPGQPMFEDSIISGSVLQSAAGSATGDVNSHASSFTSGQKKEPQIIIIPVHPSSTTRTPYHPSPYEVTTSSRPNSSNPYAINTSLTTPFHLQPLTPINPASTNNPMHFYGSNLPTNEQDKQRLQAIANTEQERAVKRLLLPAARDPNQKFKEFLEEFPELKLSPTTAARERAKKEREMLKASHSTSAMIPSSSSKSRELVPLPSPGTLIMTDEVGDESRPITTSQSQMKLLLQKEEKMVFPLNRTVGNDTSLRQLAKSISLPEPRMQKGPLAIKSHTVYEERNGSTQLPVNPYKSFEEETRIMNTGVPSGAGLLLWRPREKATAHGKYRVGLANHPRNKLMEEKKLPFVSMT